MFDLFSTRHICFKCFPILIFDENVSFYYFSMTPLLSLSLSLSLSDDANDCSVSAPVSVVVLQGVRSFLTAAF